MYVQFESNMKQINMYTFRIIENYIEIYSNL